MFLCVVVCWFVSVSGGVVLTFWFAWVVCLLFVVLFCLIELFVLDRFAVLWFCLCLLRFCCFLFLDVELCFDCWCCVCD